jgi:hypothetical protein
MAVLEQQRGAPRDGASSAGATAGPALLNDLPKLIGEVTEEQIVAAAATLRPHRRASLEVIPGHGKGAGA